MARPVPAATAVRRPTRGDGPADRPRPGGAAARRTGARRAAAGRADIRVGTSGGDPTGTVHLGRRTGSTCRGAPGAGLTRRQGPAQRAGHVADRRRPQHAGRAAAPTGSPGHARGTTAPARRSRRHPSGTTAPAHRPADAAGGSRAIGGCRHSDPAPPTRGGVTTDPRLPPTGRRPAAPRTDRWIGMVRPAEQTDDRRADPQPVELDRSPVRRTEQCTVHPGHATYDVRRGHQAARPHRPGPARGRTADPRPQGPGAARRRCVRVGPADGHVGTGRPHP